MGRDIVRLLFTTFTELLLKKILIVVGAFCGRNDVSSKKGGRYNTSIWQQCLPPPRVGGFGTQISDNQIVLEASK